MEISECLLSIYWIDEKQNLLCNNNRRQYHLNWHFYHGYEIVHILYTIKRKKRLINLICFFSLSSTVVAITSRKSIRRFRLLYSSSHCSVNTTRQATTSMFTFQCTTLFVIWSACNSKLYNSICYSLWVETFQLTWFSDSDKIAFWEIAKTKCTICSDIF